MSSLCAKMLRPPHSSYHNSRQTEQSSHKNYFLASVRCSLPMALCENLTWIVLVYFSVASCISSICIDWVKHYTCLNRKIRKPGPCKRTISHLGRLMSEIKFKIDTKHLDLKPWSSANLWTNAKSLLTILPLRGKHRKKSSVFNSSGCPKEMEMKPLCSGNRPDHEIGNKQTFMNSWVIEVIILPQNKEWSKGMKNQVWKLQKHQFGCHWHWSH